LGDWRLESGYKIIKQMIDSGVYPDAIFAGNDILAMGIFQGIKEKGLQIPGDIAVIGFDDIFNASWPAISLSTIRQPKSLMGKTAVEILLDLVKTEHEDGTVPIARKIIFDPELILSGTC
jgi:LacI family transcriptional regulator